jgi:hypothetical protein
MKLDVAAVAVVVVVAVGDEVNGRGVSTSPGWVRSGIVGFASALCLMFAGSALALDGIDLSKPGEMVAEGECSKLVQIKYPFLKCQEGEIGLAEGDATWENSRKIPIQSEFIEGNGYWGPDLNSDE